MTYHRRMAADPAAPAPGPYLQTVSGRRVNPFDPAPDEIDIADIARALGNLCRFGGHCRVFYSVAQHSVIVSELVEQRAVGALVLWHVRADAEAVADRGLEVRLGRLERRAERAAVLDRMGHVAEVRLARVVHEGGEDVLGVAADIHGLGGSARELARILEEHATTQAAADGCFGALAAQPLGADIGEFTLTTRWRDEEALRAHYATAEYQRYVELASPLLARPSDVRISYAEREIIAVADLSQDPTRQG